MKKIIILLLLVIASGCSATYNLEIKDNKFKEKIYVNYPKTDKGSLEYFKGNTFYAVMNGVSNFKKYDKKINDRDDIINVNLSYDYKLSEFKKATILKTCFEAYSVLSSSKYYTVSTSPGLICATEEDTVLLNDLDIIIKTNHIVKDHNADEVDGYIYTWHFNQKDFKSKNIYIKMYRDRYVWNYENEFYKKLALYIVCGCVIIISVICILLKFMHKRRNANKI